MKFKTDEAGDLMDELDKLTKIIKSIDEGSINSIAIELDHNIIILKQKNKTNIIYRIKNKILKVLISEQTNILERIERL